MKNQPIPCFSRLSVVAVLVLASACDDGPVATRALSPEPGRLTTEYECTVEVAAGTTSCRLSSFGSPAGPHLDLVLGTPYVSLIGSGGTNSRGDASNEDTTTSNVAVRNNISQPIGTVDGVGAHADGVRMLFNTGPYVYTVYSGTVAGSNVRLDNPDGNATFSNPQGVTYPNKPYYQYAGPLVQNAMSSSKPIRFVYDSNVRSFKYTVFVSAAAQYEHGWIAISPGAPPVLGPGATTTLAGTVYDAVGNVYADGITWTSSHTGVASVNPSTGVVTAVGEGTATITATSSVNGQRTGTRAVIVDAAPEVDSTAPADGTFNAPPGAAIVVHFSEPVSVSAGSFTLGCTSGSQPFTISGSGTSTVTLSPVSSLPTGDTCTVTVLASGVSDVDTNDGPDQLAENYSFWFVVDGFGG